MKLIGFCPMKKQDGKVVFVTDEGRGPVVGQSCDKIYLYDDMAKKITKEAIGKELVVTYGRGYSGKAYVSDVAIR